MNLPGLTRPASRGLSRHRVLRGAVMLALALVGGAAFASAPAYAGDRAYGGGGHWAVSSAGAFAAYNPDGNFGCISASRTPGVGSECFWATDGAPSGTAVDEFWLNGLQRNYSTPLGHRAVWGRAATPNGWEFSGAGQDDRYGDGMRRYWSNGNASNGVWQFRQTGAVTYNVGNTWNRTNGGGGWNYQDMTGPSITWVGITCNGGAELNGYCRTQWDVSFTGTGNGWPGQTPNIDYRYGSNGHARWVNGTWSAAWTAETGDVRFRMVLDESGWNSALAGDYGPYRLDKSAPSAPTLTRIATLVAGGSEPVADDLFRNATNIVVSAAGSTDNLSGFGSNLAYAQSTGGYRYRTRTYTNGAWGAWSGYSSGTSVTVGDEGATEICFLVTDKAGNSNSETCTTARIDRTPPAQPTVAFSTGSDNVWQKAASVTLTPTALDAGQGVRKYQYSLDDGATWTDAPGEVGGMARTYTVSAEGTTPVCFRAVDDFAPGTYSVMRCVTVKLDRTAPGAPTVTGGSLNWQAVSSVTISASGAQDTETAERAPHARVEYQVTSNAEGGWAPASPGATPGSSYTFGDDGEHWARFRNVDAAGNVSAWECDFANGVTAQTGPCVARIDNSAPVGDPDPPSTPIVFGGGTDVWSNGPTGIGATDSRDRATALWTSGVLSSGITTNSFPVDLRNSSVSVEFWFKLNSLRGFTNGNYPCLFQLFTDSINPTKVIHVCLVPEESSNPPYLYGSFYGTNASAGNIKAGEWNHVAFTYDQPSDIERLYLNGRLRSSTTSSSGPLAGSVASSFMRLGFYQQAGGNDNFTSGGFDDLALYNRALSSSEVWMRARPEASPITSGRVAYYPLNRLPSGFTLSGNARFGPGGATWNPLPPQYEHRTSTDGGASWSSPQSTTNSVTLPFAPDMLPRLSAWFDAADAATASEARGDGALTTWRDRSPQGNDATAPSSAVRPKRVADQLNGKPVIRFDGNDWLQGSAQLVRPATSMFIVGRYGNTTGRMALADLGTQSGSTYRHFGLEQNTWGTVGSRYGFWTSGNSYDSATPTSAGAKIFGVVARSGPNTAITTGTDFYVNGSSSALTKRNTVTSDNTYQDFAGARGFALAAFNDGAGSMPLTGDIAEVIVYPSTLTTAERQQVEGYLAHKWGLAADLPAEHPYKSAAPTVEMRGVTVSSPGTTNVQFRTRDGNNNYSPWSTAYNTDVERDDPRGWWRGRADAPNAAEYKAEVQNMDPWAYWTLDEKSGTSAADSGRFGRTATILNTDANYQAGANGNVLETTVQSDGKVLVGGVFTSYRGTAANHLVRLNADGSIDQAFLRRIGAAAGTSTSVYVQAIAVQSDGKILVGGNFTSWDGTALNGIVRLNADGTRDTAFSGNAVAPAGTNLYALLVQSDGKIIAGGSFSAWGGVTGLNHLVRLNSDGTRDTATTFNANVAAAVPASTVMALAAQADGKILVGGRFRYWGGSTIVNGFVRLNTDGARDTTIAAETTMVPGVWIDAIVVQPDGKILIGGDPVRHLLGSGPTYRGLIRANADGTPDTSFNANALNVYGTADLALQPDGKILVAGSSIDGYFSRLSSDGTMDAAFNTALAGNFNNAAYAVSRQSDGKIIVGGYFTKLGGITGNANRIARLNADGTQDNDFTGGDDWRNTAMNGMVYASAHQSDGKAIVVGDFTTYQGISAPRVLRTNADGTPDVDFQTTLGTGANGTVTSAVVQGDGKIVLAGNFTTWNGATVNRIVRLNADGSRDTGYVTGAGFDGNVINLAIQPDGKVIATGSFTTYAGAARQGVARLMTTGALDAVFSTNVGTAASNIGAAGVQSSGQIILVGNFTTWKGAANARGIVRLAADGTRDDAFNTAMGTGLTLTGIPGAVTVQPDDKILIGGGGISALNGTSAPSMLRLNADGSRDGSFTTNGGSGLNGDVWRFVVLPSGKIVVGGTFTTFAGAIANRVVVLSADGSRESEIDAYMGLGANGSVGGISRNPLTGAILIGGAQTTWNGQDAKYLLRLTASGVRDTTFLPAGEAGTPARPGTKGLILPNGAAMLSTPTYSSSGNYTFGAWVKFPLVDYGQGWWTLTRGSADHQLIINTDGRLGMYDNTSGGGFRTDGFNINALGLQGWHHLAVVGRGGATTAGESVFYLDGMRVSRTPYKSNSTVTHFGGYNGTNQTMGSLDEAVIFDRALGPPEIAKLARVATMRDHSGNAQNGNWFGGMAFNGTGPFTQNDPSAAAYGDGTYGTGGDAFVDTPTDEFTIETWFKTTDPNARLLTNATDDRSAHAGNDRNIRLSGGAPCGYVWRSSLVEEICATNGRSYADGQWHHYVLTAEPGRNWQVYVDGAPVVAGTTNTFSDNTVSSNFSIGGSGIGSSWLRSSIADTAMYSTALSANEVRERFLARTGQLGAGTANIDVIDPTAPTISGGSKSWSTTGRTLTVSGGSDAGGSGLDGYQYRISADGGTTWGAAKTVSPTNGPNLLPNGGLESDLSFTWRAGGASEFRTRVTDQAQEGVASVRLDTPGLAGDEGMAFLTDQANPLNDAGGASYAGSGWVRGSGTLQVWTRIYYIDGGAFTEGAKSTVTATGQWTQVAAPVATADAGRSVSYVQVMFRTLGAQATTFWLDGAEIRRVTPAQVAITGDGLNVMQARSRDRAGNVSAWVPTVTPPSSGGGGGGEGGSDPADQLDDTIAAPIDTTAPTVPTVTGGSLNWVSVPRIDFSAVGSTDAGIGGITYQRRVSTDGGVTWGDAVVNANTASISREGETMVQFRAKDALGNTSAWAPTFGSIGTMVNGNVQELTTQPDGKVLIGGDFSSVYGQSTGDLARLSAVGSSVDQEFMTNIGSGANGTIWAIAVQPDGRILVGGSFTQFNGQSAPGLVRLRANGARDTSLKIPVGPAGPSWAVRGMAVQDDGKIVVTGSFSTWDGATVNHIVRLNADGSRDTAFTTATGTGPDGMTYDAVIQPDGKIVIGGFFTTWNGTSGVTHLVRLNATGTRDTAFTTSLGATINNAVYKVLRQPDGKILIAGAFTPQAGSNHRYVARIGADGTREGAFSANLSASGNFAYGLALQPDGKILVGGNFTEFSGINASRVVRLNADGSPESAFSAATAGGADSNVNAFAIRPDGRTVIGGNFTTFAGTPSRALAIVQPSGALCATCITATANANGVARIDRTPPSSPTIQGGSLAWKSAANSTVTASGSSDALSGGVTYQYRTSPPTSLTARSAEASPEWTTSQDGAKATVSTEGETWVQFRARDAAGNISDVVTAAPGAVASNSAAPTILSPSIIDVGVTVSVSEGTWDNAPSAFAYQWQRSGDGGDTWVDIAGETNDYYQIVAGDLGSQIRVRVRATSAQGAVDAFGTILRPQAGGETAQDTPNVALAPDCTSGAASASCSWAAATPPPGKTITGYRIYVNGGRVGATAGTSYTVGDLVNGATYTVGVSAYGATWESVPQTTTVTPWVADPGLVAAFAGATIPGGWLTADGSSVSRATYPALFAALCPASPAGAAAAGTASCPYGADDASTFRLPDLRGRLVVGQDSGQAEFDVIGETGGANTVTLTEAQLPSHSHGGVTTGTGADGSHMHDYNGTGGHPWAAGGGNYVVNINNYSGIKSAATSTDGTHAHTVASEGGGTAHANLQPYMALRPLIAASPTATLAPGFVVPGTGGAPSGDWAAIGTTATASLARTANVALFQAICPGGPSGAAAVGTATCPFGAADSSTFWLPDLRGRAIVGMDIAQSEFDALGKTGGSATASVSVAQMASHSHGVNSGGAHSHSNNGMGGHPYNGGGSSSEVTISNYSGIKDASVPSGGSNHQHGLSAQGSDAAHSNLQPYRALPYRISTRRAAPLADMVFASAAVSAPSGWRALAGGASDLAGRTVVAQDTTSTAFDAVNEAGGEKSRALTIAEMPSHSHGALVQSSGAHGHSYNGTGGHPWNASGSAAEVSINWGAGAVRVGRIEAAGSAHSHTVNGAGSDQPHSELQPYMTLRMVQPPTALPPSMTAAPAYTRGTLTPGTPLTAEPGTWSASGPITYRYEWLRCAASGDTCTSIGEGATGASYTLADADFGQSLRVVVTAVTSAGDSDPVTSAAFAVTGARNTGAPTVSGNTYVGQTLTATRGSWSGSPTPTFSYTWERCTGAGPTCVTIPGATATTYTLQPGDATSRIRVRVTATNTRGATSATSSLTPAIDLLQATGGEVTDVGNWRVHAFKSTGSSTFTVVGGTNVAMEYLVVAGGGGGGMDMGGGGGGGGVLQGANALTPGSYAITVGGGGAGAPAACANGVPCSHLFNVNASNGGNSAISGPGIAITALGGGGGGSSVNAYTNIGSINNSYGKAGGSGGGASGYNWGNWAAGWGAGTGTAGQGYNGGSGGNQYYSGGGGGAGGVGASGNAQANGGVGVQSSILGTAYYFGGGGGGAGYSICGGNGGNGGGGGGAVCATSGGAGLNAGAAGGGGTTNSQSNRAGGNGGANTGGGGGGGSHYNYTNNGGNGGSGIVVIRYHRLPVYVNTSLPTVTGTPVWGSRLTAAPGTWQGAGAVTYGYEWFRCDVAGGNCVSTGSTSQAYTPDRADAGATLRVRVVASNGVESDPAWSAATTEVSIVRATGGSQVYDSGDYRIHRFNSSGTFTLSSPERVRVEYLVVGGGGGGGMDMGGGGGAGGFIEGNAAVGSGTYQITVGAGGRGAPAGCTTTDLGTQPCDHQFAIGSFTGESSSIKLQSATDPGAEFSVTALGGGGGGSSYVQYSPGAFGKAGGSGGGASGYSDNRSPGYGAGAGTTGQGFSGGAAGNQYYSGGGGGAGGAGTSGNGQPHGGPGKASSILGTMYYFAGGGGGAGYSICGGNGGIGGGGAGAVCGTGGGGSALNSGEGGQGGGTNSHANTRGSDAGANTGGGGGGGSHYNRNNRGGNGGSGIVVVRYKRF